MKANKMQAKIDALKLDGFSVESMGFTGINNRRYKYAVMIKGEQRITVNHQGGTNGLVSVMGQSNRRTRHANH